eukprot:s827_g3.t1
MSDDEGPRGKGGKRGGKGGGKGGGGKGGDRKGGKGSSDRAGGGSGGGFNAQIVDSDLTAEEIRVFQRKRGATGAPSGKEEEPKEEDGKMKFQKKADRSTATAAATRKLAKKLSAEAGEALGFRASHNFSTKKQRLSFDADEGDDDDD